METPNESKGSRSVRTAVKGGDKFKALTSGIYQDDWDMNTIS